MMINYFITGITGQDGIFLTKKLLQSNKNIHIYGSTRQVENLNFYKKLSSICSFDDSRISLIQIDLLNSSSVHTFLSDIKPKQIYNLTGPSSVYESYINPLNSRHQITNIFENLTKLEGESSSHTAGDFCSKDIVKLKPSNTLHDAIKKTSYAISTDETRYVLNGIYVSFRDGKMIFVATNGRRLAMVENDLEYPASHETDIIVPSKAVNELQRMLGGEGEAIVKLSGNQISFEIGDSIIVSKLIEGNYPNYKQVIPGERKERVTINREEFLNTVRRVSLLTSESSNSVKLSFSKGSIDVQANSKDIGEAKEPVVADYDGEEFAIDFNPEFLMAPLKNLSEESVYLDLIDGMSPGVIRIDGSFLYVIMPMRVSS